MVAEWAQSLSAGATILDLGCGTGIPISLTLIERGFNVYGVDASASMIAEYRANFPTAPVQCAAVEDSDFFGRTFDGVVAWGLFFLLGADAQRELIAKIATALPPGGHFLFTAPYQVCNWLDAMTGRTSMSLGHEAYRSALESEGMSLIATCLDEGQNHHYSALKKPDPGRLHSSSR